MWRLAMAVVSAKRREARRRFVKWTGALSIGSCSYVVGLGVLKTTAGGPDLTCCAVTSRVRARDPAIVVRWPVSE